MDDKYRWNGGWGWSCYYHQTRAEQLLARKQSLAKLAGNRWAR